MSADRPTALVTGASGGIGEALARRLAADGHDRGVTVTALCPGPIATGFQAGADMGDSKLVKGKRLMTAEECAAFGVRAMNRGRVIAIPGIGNRVQALSPRFRPRRFVPGVVRRAQAPTHWPDVSGRGAGSGRHRGRGQR